MKSTVLIMPGKGKRVNSTVKTIIFNVSSYFERQSQKSKGRCPLKLTSRIADATGYSERIVSEKKSLERAAFGSPVKQCKVERKIITDDFDMEGIRLTVHDFYRAKGTLRWNPCLLRLKRTFCLMVRKITLWKLLHNLGFRYMISGMCMSSPV